MTSGARTDEAYRRLTKMLDDPRTLAALLSVSPSRMTPREKDALRRLNRHFQRSEGEDVDREGDEEVRTPRKRQRSENNPMRRLMNLESLSLAPAIQRYFDEHGTDPEEFLDDDALEHKIKSFNTKETLGDAFRACYQYAIDLDKRSSKDVVRWCFTMIMFFDLIKLIKPGATGGRMGHLMKKDAVEFLEAVFDSENTQIDEARQRLNQWSRHGKKLDQLCAEFGPGCLFYLTDQLSKDFMEYKFTETGPYHDEVFAHLRQLGLKEEAEKTPANELGQQIRDFLSQPFREHLRTL